MVALSATGFAVEIDKYEAVRTDGIGCSLAGAEPWSSVSYREAKNGCADAGKRLCTLEEWQRACRSVGTNYEYPYGPTHDPAACNGQGAARGAVAPTGSFPDCDTSQGVLDLSGNVREWVEGPDGPVLAGGSFASGQSDLRCDQYIAPAGGADDYEGGVGDGFRCCR